MDGKFKIIGDCLFLETPQFNVGDTDIVSLHPIIDKETFKELYKLWIKPERGISEPSEACTFDIGDYVEIADIKDSDYTFKGRIISKKNTMMDGKNYNVEFVGLDRSKYYKGSQLRKIDNIDPPKYKIGQVVKAGNNFGIIEKIDSIDNDIAYFVNVSPDNSSTIGCCCIWFKEKLVESIDKDKYFL